MLTSSARSACPTAAVRTRAATLRISAPTFTPYHEFSTSSAAQSTRRSRRVHREALAVANETVTGRIPGFTGRPPAATPASLRLAAKTRMARSTISTFYERKSKESMKPPNDLGYEPQKDKPSSVFFWSDEAMEHDQWLMKSGNYPPKLPTFKHNENQQISKCHPSVWMASPHHLQMMHEGYDRIAFLGDSVAGKVISDLLLTDYYCIAGTMGQIKSRLVSNAQFAYFSRIYNIPCKNNENAQGDAFEALVGALYLDGKRDGIDADKVIYDWMKELVTPWIELYISLLSESQRERVVSLHRAVPIGIAVATSDSPDSHQVMMAWESNIATHMIENRGKVATSVVDRRLLQQAMEQQALGAPIDITSSSSLNEITASPALSAEEKAKKEAEQARLEEYKLKTIALQREMEHLQEKAKALTAAALNQTEAGTTNDAVATSTTSSPPAEVEEPEPMFSDAAIAARAEREREKEREREEFLKAHREEKRKREEEAAKVAAAAAAEQAKIAAEKAKIAAIEKAKADALHAQKLRDEIHKREEKARELALAAREEADKIKRKADEEAAAIRDKERPKTKAEKKADKKVEKLEAELRRLEQRRLQVDKSVAASKYTDAIESEAEAEADAEAEVDTEAVPEVETPEAEPVKTEAVKKAEPPASTIPPAKTPAATTPPKAPVVADIPSAEKIANLISSKEAKHEATLLEKEAALRASRVRYDIQQMEEEVSKRRDRMLAQNAHLTPEQREQFKNGWEIFMQRQRDAIEREAGVEIGSISGLMEAERKLAEAKEEPSPASAAQKKEEPSGLFGRLWGALSGKQ